MVGVTGFEPATSSSRTLISDHGAAVAVLFPLVGSGPADACCRCAASSSTGTDDFSMTMPAAVLTACRLSSRKSGQRQAPFDRAGARVPAPGRGCRGPLGEAPDQDLALPCSAV